MSEPTFQAGDVVFVEGASAILGDVVKVELSTDGEEFVEVRWRETVTTEVPDDLVLEERPT